MSNARATRVVLLAVSALVLAACTPAVSANAPADPFVDPIVPQGGSAQSGGQGTGPASAPHRGSGAVGVALVGGAQLPEQVVSAFTKDTGFTVSAAAYDAVGDVPAQGTDVVLGLDGADALAAAGASLAGHVAVPQARTAAGTEVAGAEGAVAYGRDDVCVVADRAWMSANMLAVPSSIQELASASYAGLLAVPDPASTSVGRAFVQAVSSQVGQGLGAFATSLSPRVGASTGETLAQWSAADRVTASYWSSLVGAPASPPSAGLYPLVVAPASLASAALTNTGAESYGAPVASTCIARTLYAAGVPSGGAVSDGAASLIAWLQGGAAQRALAEAGAAAPLDSGVGEGTRASWASQGSGREADETAADPQSVAAAVSAWGAR